MAISVTFDNGALVFFIIIISTIFVIYFWLKLMKMIRNSKKALKSLAEKYSMDYVEDASDLVLNDEQIQTTQNFDISSILFDSDDTRYTYIHKNFEIDENPYDIFLGICEERNRRRYRIRHPRRTYTSYSYSTFVIIKKLKSKVSFKIEKAIPLFGSSTKVKYGDLTPTATNMEDFDKKYAVWSSDEMSMKRILTGEVTNYLLSKKLPITVAIELRQGILKFYTNTIFLQTEEEYLELYNFMLTLLKNIENADN
ncbi:MAG: hypothetical protein QXR30_03455 [Candidatus Woesearchaeota archaeon]